MDSALNNAYVYREIYSLTLDPVLSLNCHVGHINHLLAKQQKQNLHRDT